MLSGFVTKVKKDVAFRIKLFLCISLIGNFLYAVFLFAVSKITHSKWFFVMSIYYGLLSFARVFVFTQRKAEDKRRVKIMRVCGYFLLLINAVASVMMFLLIYRHPPVKHHEITVITLATYTFSTLTVAIISSIRYFKKNDHLYSCVKMISLISASVSLVTLTNTMLAAFGGENTQLRAIILPLLSAAVSVFMIVSAIFMIRKANLDMRIYEK